MTVNIRLLCKVHIESKQVKTGLIVMGFDR